MTATELRFTAPRRQGLEALFRVHPKPGRYSNTTDTDRGYVYWQSANWLVEQELAYYSGGLAWLNLTEDGLGVAKTLFPELDPESPKWCRDWDCEREADAGGYCAAHRGGESA